MSQTDAAAMEMHSATGQPNRKILMWAFIGSECMLFGSLIIVAIASGCALLLFVLPAAMCIWLARLVRPQLRSKDLSTEGDDNHHHAAGR